MKTPAERLAAHKIAAAALAAEPEPSGSEDAEFEAAIRRGSLQFHAECAWHLQCPDAPKKQP